MYWWRIEFDADGAIAKCDLVEKAESKTSSVRYIRAQTRKEALDKALLWHERRKRNQSESSARLRARRKAAGECIRCGNPLDSTSKQLCSAHMAARKAWKDLAAQGLVAPREKGDPLTMHMRDKDYQRQNYKLSEQLPDLLSRYDALDGTPGPFRAWLVDEIASIEARYPLPGYPK